MQLCQYIMWMCIDIFCCFTDEYTERLASRPGRPIELHDVKIKSDADEVVSVFKEKGIVAFRGYFN